MNMHDATQIAAGHTPAARQDGSQGGLEPKAAETAVGLTRLGLTDFRSYERAELRLDAGFPVVLTGPNGAGKTNLLEAVSYLSPGRGIRVARLADVTRNGAPSGAAWAVSGTVADGRGGETRLGTGLEPGRPIIENHSGPRRARRVVRVDGESVGGPAALSSLFPVSWITPQMDQIFAEAPSGRRRFLDRLVYGFDPDHARRVGAYDRATRERGRLLRDHGGGADPKWMSALENTMAEEGIAIAAARRETVARLRGAIAAGVGPFPGADVSVSGQVEDWLSDMAAVDAEDRLRGELERARGEDAAVGRATVGPQKSDLVVHHKAKGAPANQCSTGEQKALLIAILLADVRVHSGLGNSVPVLLLDEVAAHLDKARRNALFDELSRLESQVWLTGTDRELFQPLAPEAQFFSVEEGRVARA
jgi:DNA replication and repair protein RecF